MAFAGALIAILVVIDFLKIIFLGSSTTDSFLRRDSWGVLFIPAICICFLTVISFAIFLDRRLVADLLPLGLGLGFCREISLP